MAARRSATPSLTREQQRLVAPRAGVNPTYRDMQPVKIPGYHCNVRIYPSGNWAFEPRSADDQADYLDHNRTFRPGCAIFVDGVLVEASWLDGESEKAAGIAKRLSQYKPPCTAAQMRALPRL